ncbi:MAG: M48 family metalloprotease [Betaproteobacteria bacterium]|nr:M48 family metalloprotease [Betaproteobacteria bacterium]
MDFFAQQDEARRASRRLVPWFLLAVAFVGAAMALVAVLAVTMFLMILGAVPGAGEHYIWHGLPGYFADIFARVAPPVSKIVGLAVAAIILGVTAWRMWQLRQGGTTIAGLLGAHYLERSRVMPAEARLLNVVEEMAIASGIAVPPVYLLNSENAINALVAGHSPNEAVIIVTRGAMQQLSRDELQGVMGHEFSHILNGDMALNMRLVSLLAGIACFGEWGEAMVHAGAKEARGKAREERGGEVLAAMFGAAIAFVGFPGLFAAEAIKAAISRQRELLADAASVQFTRNPDGIAGALDTIRYLKAGTTLRTAYAIELSHMFFAPAVVRWWAWPSHPPIEARIRRVHPRFMQEDYRRTRHASTYRDGRVAVLDGAGNVVKVIGGLGALAAVIEAPRPEHVDHARRLLERLPAGLRTQLGGPESATHAVLGLLRGELAAIPRHQALLLIELALPALKQLKQKRRDEFLAEVTRTIEADRKMTLTEFVQSTFLQQHLRAGAGKPIPTQFRKVEEVAQDAHLVLSLIAHASQGDTEAAHAKGRAVLGVALPAPLAAAEITGARLEAALERLRHLQPFQKPRVLKACVEAAAADGTFRLAEAELVRAVAATLDCPLPPVIGALDPATLAA